MLYMKNLPNWERVLRVVVGVLVAVGALIAWPGTIGWLVAASAAGAVVSGLLGFCPACAMVGRRLDKGH